jgi:beta-glucosidase
MTQKYKFPHGFLWGAATAAHQIEGNNTNSDWWAWEHSEKRRGDLKVQGLDPKKFESGETCDSYHKFEADFAMANNLGHNATRLSVEWARLEPKEGEFSEKEFEHYEEVLKSAKANGLSTFVTLHHFTSPIWFMTKGGFEKQKNVSFFVRYAVEVAKRLGEWVDFWLTINEPEVYSGQCYLAGVWPPQKRSLFSGYQVANNLCLAHNLASTQIKLVSPKPVSMAYHLSDLQPHGFLGEFVTSIVHKFSNEYILSRTIDNCDYIGVNYYFHHHVGIFGPRKHSHSRHEENDLGWGIHPDGLERVLLFLKKFNKPIYITENGLADAKDQKREKFIKDHLFYIHQAITKGVKVRGYLHWSLLDNFEWEKGFEPRFGLVSVDYENDLKRLPRMSALKYAEICRKNELEY